ARAARDVERALAGTQAGERQREFLPQPVRAARHEIVHEVVVARDGVENAADAALLLVPRDALVPEVGVAGLLGVAHRAASISSEAKALAFPRVIGYKAQLFERGSCKGRWSTTTGLFCDLTDYGRGASCAPCVPASGASTFAAGAGAVFDASSSS